MVYIFFILHLNYQLTHHPANQLMAVHLAFACPRPVSCLDLMVIVLPTSPSWLSHYRISLVVLSCYLVTAGSGWDFENFKTYEIHPVSLSCMCEVEGKLWIGAENYCFIFNLSTRTTEVSEASTSLYLPLITSWLQLLQFVKWIYHSSTCFIAKKPKIIQVLFCGLNFYGFITSAARYDDKYRIS